MRVLFRPPGVYRPQADTRLVLDALRQVRLPERARAMDVGTGTGAIAVALARSGTHEVTAVDSTKRAVLAARVNGLLNGVTVRVERGDFLGRLPSGPFDLIVSNPPYVPSTPDIARSGHSAARSWNAGADGRVYLDRLCAAAPRLLAADGTLLILQSAVCGVDKTLDELRERGLHPHISARHIEPFGPVMRGRAVSLESRGLIDPGQRHEELVVIRGNRAGCGDESATATVQGSAAGDGRL